jgi:hypothetical protein
MDALERNAQKPAAMFLAPLNRSRLAQRLQ